MTGLIGSPPGVATAATIAMTRSACRLRAARACDVTIPTFESSTRTIGNSIARPNARNSVVTKPKYASAVMRAWRSGDWKLRRKADAYGRTRYATTTPRTKKASASGTQGRASRRSCGVSPGEMNAQSS